MTPSIRSLSGRPALRLLALAVAAAGLCASVPAEAGGRYGGPGYHAHGPGGYYHHGPRWGFGWGLGIGLGAAALAYPGWYGPGWYGYAAPGYIVVPPAVVDAPEAPPAPAARAPQAPDPIFYPRNGQSAAQTEADRQDCNRWAVGVPGAVGDASVFQRATLACMDGRGYTVR